jgi:hypothetical protein
MVTIKLVGRQGQTLSVRKNSCYFPWEAWLLSNLLGGMVTISRNKMKPALSKEYEAETKVVFKFPLPPNQSLLLHSLLNMQLNQTA